MGILIIDWAQFVPALLLLLTPVALLEHRRVHFRAIDREWSQYRGRMATLWLHYFDFGRAALGSWLLLAAVAPLPQANGLARFAPLLIPAVVQVLGVILQTVFCRSPDSANAPFAFVTGLLIGSPSPLAAVLAVVLAIAIAMGSRTPAAFFPLLGLWFAATAALFGGKALLIKVAALAAAVILPPLWSLLFRRELVIPYRSHRTTPTDPPISHSKLK